MATCIAVASLTAATSHASAQSPVSDWNVTDHLKPAEVIVQSHRGAGDLAPENTIEAFELGWELGTWPESDVRTTTDGVIVAFHDANFKRVVKDVAPELASKGVKDVTWEQLKKMDVGSWKGDSFKGHHVSTMEDIFAVMSGKPDRHLYMDIKDVDLKKLAEQVRKHGVGAQVIFASQYHDLIVEWKKLVPDSAALLWIGGKTEQEQKDKFAAAKARNFEGITQVQIHTHLTTDSAAIKRDSVNPFRPADDFLIEAGKELRKHNIVFQTLPWEGNTQEVYWKLLDLGLMAFATDHPKVTRKAIEDYYNLPKAGSN